VFEEVAKPHGTEVDVEEALVNLFESDVVTPKQGADENAVGVPSDATVSRDEAGLEVTRVGEGLKSLREGSR